MSGNVVQLVPREAVMACPNPRPVRVPGFGIFDRCGLVLTLCLFDGKAYCPRCGKLLRWPRDRAT